MKDSQLLGVLVESSQKLQSIYLQIKQHHPDAAELVRLAGVNVADAIGRVATARAKIEVDVRDGVADAVNAAVGKVEN